MNRALSIYIHVPFCLSKCGYCDFISYAGKNDLHGFYFSALLREIEHKAPFFMGYNVTTVFFGGGTPTVLSAAQLSQALNTLKDNFIFTANIEITAEANPETVDETYLRDLRDCGFNRVSFGAQTFDDALLLKIGRAHNAQTAENAVKAAQHAGFDNIGLDLMFGLPSQTLAGFEYDLRKAVSLGAAHISCYSLTIAENSPFSANGIKPADDDLDREMYALANMLLEENGYIRYEISNFAKRGYVCEHNTAYWTGGDYLGLGLGAHSYIDGTRFHNTQDLAAYIGRDFSREDELFLTERDKMAEYMILGLRLSRGVSDEEFITRFACDMNAVYGDVIEKHIAGGLLKRSAGVVALTARGIDLSNRVFADLL